MLVALKSLAGLKPNELRARQEGGFLIEHDVTKVKFVGTLTCQGVKTGERVVMEVVSKKKKPFKTLEDIGMREAIQERLREHLRAQQGIVLISAPPGGGFTTTWCRSCQA